MRIFIGAALALALLAACTTSPTSGAQNFRAGFAAEQVGNYDEAIRLYTAALQSNLPQDSQAAIYARRSVAYMLKGDADQAVADADTALRLKPNFEAAYNNRGLAYLGKQEYDLAIADLDVAIRLNPTPTAYLNRGVAHQGNQQPDLAVSDFDEAIRLRPAYADAYFYRGETRVLLGDFRKAAGDFDIALRLRPDFANAYNGRGLAYFRTADYSKARSDFDAAILLDPKSAAAFGNRGMLKFVARDYQSAANDVALSVQITPTNAYNVLWLHVLRHKTGVEDKDEYAGNASKIDQSKWPNPIVGFYLGRVTADQLHQIVAQSDAKAQPLLSCQVSFHIGEYALIHNDAKTAKLEFQKANETCAATSLERALSQVELQATAK